MKIKISFTLDVDAEAWSMDHDVSGAAEIRRDVQAYVKHAVTSHFETHGYIVKP